MVRASTPGSTGKRAIATAEVAAHTRDQARADVFDYIERFYNPRRRHSTIGHLSPMDFEALAEAH